MANRRTQLQMRENGLFGCGQLSFKGFVDIGASFKFTKLDLIFKSSPKASLGVKF